MLVRLARVSGSGVCGARVSGARVSGPAAGVKVGTAFQAEGGVQVEAGVQVGAGATGWAGAAAAAGGAAAAVPIRRLAQAGPRIGIVSDWSAGRVDESDLSPVESRSSSIQPE